MSAPSGWHSRRARSPHDDAARGCGPRLREAVPGCELTASSPWNRMRRRVARMLAVARIETLHLTHDHTTISLIALVPAIQLVLFGYGVNLDPKHIPIAIARDDASPVDRL